LGGEGDFINSDQQAAFDDDSPIDDHGRDVVGTGMQRKRGHRMIGALCLVIAGAALMPPTTPSSPSQTRARWH
jgi:hypothetical protein